MVRGSHLRWVQHFSPYPSRQALMPNQPHAQLALSFPGTNCPERDANHSPLSSTEVKHGQSCASNCHFLGATFTFNCYVFFESAVQNLGSKTGHPQSRDIPQHFRGNVGIEIRSSSLPLPSKSFPNHYWITLSFATTYSYACTLKTVVRRSRKILALVLTDTSTWYSALTHVSAVRSILF